MKKRIWNKLISILTAILLVVGFVPNMTVAVMAADGIELYVGGQQITESGCYEKNQDGNWTKVEGSDGTEPASGQFSYDAATFTLTLNGAEISYDGIVKLGDSNYNGSVIAYNASAAVSLNIVLQGKSTITGAGGIRVQSDAGDASLSIAGPGSLDVEPNGSNSGITLCSTKNTNLDIDGADVTASSRAQYGVYLISSTDTTSTSTITVNNGSLTTGGNGNVGIYYYWSGTNNAGTSSLTVSGNAVVDTRNSQIMAQNKETVVQVGAGSDGNGGIVFNGKSGTVYGDVTLDESITINQDETLRIPSGSSLNSNNHLTNNGTIIVENGGVLTGETGGKVVYAPSITTESLPEGKVNEEYSASLTADGSEPIEWSVTQGSLPNGLTLNTNTGEITGVPTTAGSYPFAVKAENAYGSKTKELTININDAKTYSVSVTPAKITLPSVKEGYAPQDPEYITIKNTGNQTIKLEDHGKNPWLIITLDKNTLKPNEEAKVSIKLIDGLSAEKRSTLYAFITYTSEDGNYRDYAHFEVTYEIRHDMQHVEAKEATHLEEGNIEYWYCEYCDKYYDGALGTNELSLEDITIPKLTDHTATDTWYHDENSHWHTCECGEVLDKEAHEYKWVIDKEATVTSEGLKHEECSICGYQKEAIVIPVVGTENQPPVINAKDQTLTVGDKFDPMKGVTATDQEDGDLTDKIVITKNTVDTSKASKYTVDYEVTDNGGTRVRKTIVVTVKEKSADQTTTTDSKKTNGTKTSAGLGIGLFSSLAGASAVGAGILSVLKKRNGK